MGRSGTNGRSQAAPKRSGEENITERCLGVLYAVKLAQERWTDPDRTHVFDQLHAPRMASLIDMERLSGSQFEREMTKLKKGGLIEFVAAVGRSGKRWQLTSGGASYIEHVLAKRAAELEQ